jgi:hypothetical protein
MSRNLAIALLALCSCFIAPRETDIGSQTGGGSTTGTGGGSTAGGTGGGSTAGGTGGGSTAGGSGGSGGIGEGCGLLEEAQCAVTAGCKVNRCVLCTCAPVFIGCIDENATPQCPLVNCRSPDSCTRLDAVHGSHHPLQASPLDLDDLRDLPGHHRRLHQ